MRRKPPVQTRPPFSSSKKLDLVAWASLYLTGAAMLSAMLVALADRDWMSLAAPAFLLAVILVVMVILWRRHSPEPPPETTVFRPFDELDIESVWHRPSDTQRIVEAIHDSGDKIPVVVGSSGVGKTTLLEVMVREELGDTVAYSVFPDGYEGLRAKLPAMLPDPHLDEETVIVLDQFEQWFAHLNRQPSPTVRENEREWLRTKLREAHALPNCTMVISIRCEWYYDLGFLGDLIPAPSESCCIDAPEVDNTSSEMRRGMLASFTEVVKKRDLAEALLERIGAHGTLSPLEVQLVGAWVEVRVKSKKFDLDHFDNEVGGVQGAIDAYFKLILNGAARPTLCMKILCGLSIKTRFREQTAHSDMRAGLFERDEAIEKAMEYLVGTGLVVEHAGGSYELAHDYLAEWFNSKSTTELDPVARDNILVYIGAGGRHSDAVLTAEERASHKRIRWGLIAVVSLLFVMAMRLIYFGIDLTLVGPSLAHPVTGSLFDASYIVILTPYAAWIIYIALFYDRVLIHLNESKTAHACSVLIIISLIVATLLGIVIPYAWLLGITIGGLAFAGKLIWLSRRPDLNRAARQRLSKYGMTTFFNLIFVAIAGVAGAYISLRYVSIDQYLGTWLIANLAASALMTYWCLVLTPMHVSRSAVAQLLGLIGRPSPLSLARSDT